MSEAPPTAPAPPQGGLLQPLKQRWHGLSDHGQVGLCLAAVSGGLVLWALFWPVPTEVTGTGVLIYPDNAGILNARSG
ncbi:MAG: NHLP bacteriocin system secretion protein, partial [Synechococcaceae cyanobacterium]|nr:NHLP bacteriocin system secretion protein [Synechococcaceae cyanobacterium]